MRQINIFLLLFAFNTVISTFCDFDELSVAGLQFTEPSSVGHQKIATPTFTAKKLIYSCLRGSTTCFNTAITSPTLTLNDLNLFYTIPHQTTPVNSLFSACASLPGAEAALASAAERLAGGLEHLPDHVFSDGEVTWGARRSPGCTEGVYTCAFSEYRHGTAGALAKKAAWGCVHDNKAVFDAALDAGADVNAENRFAGSDSSNAYLFNVSLLSLCAGSPLASHAVPRLLMKGAHADSKIEGHAGAGTKKSNDVDYDIGSTPLHMLNYSSPSAPRLVCALLWVLAGQDTAATAGADICDKVLTLYNTDTEAAATMARHVLTANSAGMLPLHYAAALHAPAADPAARALRTLLTVAGYATPDQVTAHANATSGFVLFSDFFINGATPVHYLGLAHGRGAPISATCALAYAAGLGKKSLADEQDVCLMLKEEMAEDAAFAERVKTYIAGNTSIFNPLTFACTTFNETLDPAAAGLRQLLALGGEDTLLVSNSDGFSTKDIVYKDLSALTSIGFSVFPAPPRAAICTFAWALEHPVSELPDITESTNADTICDFVHAHGANYPLAKVPGAASMLHYFSATYAPSSDPTAAAVREIMKLMGVEQAKTAARAALPTNVRFSQHDGRGFVNLEYDVGSTPLHFASNMRGDHSSLLCALAAGAAGLDMHDFDSSNDVCKVLFSHQSDLLFWESVRTYALTLNAANTTAFTYAVYTHNAAYDAAANGIRTALALTGNAHAGITLKSTGKYAPLSVVGSTPLHLAGAAGQYGAPRNAYCYMMLALLVPTLDMHGVSDPCVALDHRGSNPVDAAVLANAFATVDSYGRVPLFYILQHHQSTYMHWETVARVVIANKSSVTTADNAGSSAFQYINYSVDQQQLMCLLSLLVVDGALSETHEEPCTTLQELLDASANRETMLQTISQTLSTASANGNTALSNAAAAPLVGSPNVRWLISHINGTPELSNQFFSAGVNGAEGNVSTEMCLIAWWGAGLPLEKLSRGQICRMVYNEMENESVRASVNSAIAQTATQGLSALTRLVMHYDVQTDPTAESITTLLKLGHRDDAGYSTIASQVDFMNRNALFSVNAYRGSTLSVIDAILSQIDPSLRSTLVNAVDLLHKSLVNVWDTFNRYSVLAIDHLVSRYGMSPIFTAKMTAAAEYTRSAKACLLDEATGAETQNYFSYEHCITECLPTCPAGAGWRCRTDTEPDVGKSAWRYTQMPCTGGTYQPAAGQSECITCDQPGYGVDRVGYWGVGCSPCADDELVIDHQCIPCPANSTINGTRTGCLTAPGFYFPNGDYWDLRPCPPGHTCDGTQVTPTPCTAGSACPEGSSTSSLCTGATYALDKADTCTECAPGHLLHIHDGLNVACTRCPAGTYTSTAGATTCTPCPVGSFALSGAAACTICPAGTYTPAEGATACTPCPAGHACPGDSVLAPQKCPDGQFALAGAASCSACLANTEYLYLRPQTECSYCPAGTYLQGTACQPCHDLKAPFYCELKEVEPDRHQAMHTYAIEECREGNVAISHFSCVPCPRDCTCTIGGTVWHYMPIFDISTKSGKINIGILVVLASLTLFLTYILGFIMISRNKKPRYERIDSPPPISGMNF